MCSSPPRRRPLAPVPFRRRLWCGGGGSNLTERQAVKNAVAVVLLVVVAAAGIPPREGGRLRVAAIARDNMEREGASYFGEVTAAGEEKRDMAI